MIAAAAISPGQTAQTVKPPAYQNKTTPTQAPSEVPKTAPQVEQVLPSYEGQTVTSLELAGQPDIDTSKLRPLLQQHAGEKFSQEKINASMAALKQKAGFSEVTLEVRPEAKGVRVLFVLQPAVYFGIYEFPGVSGRFSYSRLLQVTNYPPRGAYTPVDVQSGVDSLVTFYRRNGYFLAKVNPEIRTDRQHGVANVFFNTELGQRAKYGEVKIEGATPQEAAELKGTIQSIRARLRRAAILPGKTYKLHTVRNATHRLQNHLMDQGYLAASVRLTGANYNPETNRADISFRIKAGPEVNVKVEGAHLWSWIRRRLIPMYQQVGVDPELIQEGRRNLISYFQTKGYFSVKVTTDVQQQPKGETIVYQIAKGPRHKVEDVRIAGNREIDEDRLMPHVKVQKAHLFGHGNYSEKLVKESVGNLSNLYKAEGFSSVSIAPEVKKDNGNIVVVLRVNEGPQDIVESLRVEGANSLPQSTFAPHGLKLQPGKPYSQKLADEDRNTIGANYLRQGYLNSTFHEKLSQNPKDPHRLNVVYQIHEGPQVRIATVVTLGREKTQQRLVNLDITGLRPGHPLTADQMMKSESELYQPGIFDWARVDPRRQISTQTEEDVLVKLHEAKRNTLNYSFGFEVINRGGSVPSGTVATPGLPPVGLPSTFKTSEKTFWGPRGTVEYTRENIWGKAASLTFAGLGARLDQRGSVVLTDPHFRWTKWAADVSLSGEHDSQNPIFTSRIGQLGFQLRRALNPDKTQNLFLRYSFRETGVTRLLIPDLIPSGDQHVRLSTFSTTYLRDTRDSVLDAHKGIYESLELDFNPAALSNFDFGRLLAQTAYYKKIPGNIIWANSVRIGLEHPFGSSHVPLSEKFFSGGGSTLRGFPLNGAGPQQTIQACGNPADQSTCTKITVPVGGDELLIVNSEFRIPVLWDLPLVHKNLGFAVFYDGGNVFRTVGFHGQYTNSIGAGIRYSTPVGPIRFDIGHNLNAPPGIKSTQYFVTLGQAF